jgi:hypothetical protein
VHTAEDSGGFEGGKIAADSLGGDREALCEFRDAHAPDLGHALGHQPLPFLREHCYSSTPLSSVGRFRRRFPVCGSHHIYVGLIDCICVYVGLSTVPTQTQIDPAENVSTGPIWGC